MNCLFSHSLALYLKNRISQCSFCLRHKDSGTFQKFVYSWTKALIKEKNTHTCKKEQRKRQLSEQWYLWD